MQRRRTTKHISKTMDERREYAANLDRAGYEPTVEEDEPGFQQSDEVSDPELQDEVPIEMRDAGAWRETIYVLKKHYFTIGVVIIGPIIAAILIFFGTTFSLRLGNLEGKVDEMSKSLERIETNQQQLLGKFYEQGLIIQENKTKVEFLEKELHK